MSLVGLYIYMYVCTFQIYCCTNGPDLKENPIVNNLQNISTFLIWVR